MMEKKTLNNRKRHKDELKKEKRRSKEQRAIKILVMAEGHGNSVDVDDIEMSDTELEGGVQLLEEETAK